MKLIYRNRNERATTIFLSASDSHVAVDSTPTNAYIPSFFFSAMKLFQLGNCTIIQ